MGLKETGIVAGATLKAMNVPAKVRFKELASSADRLAGANFEFGERYVVVNLPSTAVEAVENGKVAHRYVAIVGDPDHPSPEISAHIQAVNLNPTWTVPTSIIKKEIIPRMQRDPGYLTRQKIRILDGSGQAINPKSINWNSERAVELYAEAGFRRRQFARLDPDQHAEQARRLHARHAIEAAVRRRLPLPEPRLRARSGRLRLRRSGCSRARRAARAALGTRPRCRRR